VWEERIRCGRGAHGHPGRVEAGNAKISLTKVIRSATAMGLAEAKHCTHEVLAGKSVVLTFPTAADADKFCADAQHLGAVARCETWFR
jgi:ribosomal protein L7/L12